MGAHQMLCACLARSCVLKASQSACRRCGAASARYVRTVACAAGQSGTRSCVLVRIRAQYAAWHALACSRPHTVHAAVAVQFKQGIHATLCCRLVQRGFLAFESWVFVRALVCSTLPGTLLRAQGLTLCMPPLPCRVQQSMHATLCCSIVWHLDLEPRVVCML